MLNKARQILSITIILFAANVKAMENDVINLNSFSEIHKKLFELNNKKISLQTHIKSAKQNNSDLNIDFVLRNVKLISIELNYLFKKISQIKDNSQSCEQAINIYENLFDYLYSCLDDYYDKNHML